MLVTPRELRVAAASLQAEAKTLLDNHAADAEGISDAIQTRFDGLMTEAESLLARARKVEDLYSRVGNIGEDLTKALTETRGARPRALETSTLEATEGEGDKRYSFGDFLRNIAIVNDRSVTRETYESANDRLANCYRTSYRAWDDPSRPTETRNMALNSGTSGGYLVPETLYANVLRAAAEQSIIRPNATVMPMDADTVRLPMLDHTTAPTSGNTAFFGGIQATWTGEASSLTAKDPGFRQAVLTAHELTGYTEVDRTLIQNSAVSVDALLNSLFGGAVAWYEDYSFLAGSGNGQPIGITKAPAFTLSSSRAASTTITLADAAKVYAKMLPSALNDAIWVVSIGALPAFLQMTGVTNGVVLPVGFYTPDGGARAPITTLLGRPVYVTEKLPTLNTNGDFIFINPKYYVVGDRRAMEVAVSEHFKFQNNQIAYRFVHRVGGLPWINGAITLQDGTTTVSPFVGLSV
jgi:hypothetical protein